MYRDILGAREATTVSFWGLYESRHEDASWLVVEFLDSAVWLNKTSNPYDWLVRAAEWSGRFHTETAGGLDGHQLGLLNTYSAEYYEGWAGRTADLTASWHGDMPWLPGMCERFSTVVPLLTGSAPTMIHGEFYPENILIDRGEVYPVDWESAALAAGEIDLASLTEGSWPAEVVEQCVTAYVSSRWPLGAPGSFSDTLSAARIYLHLRWLGDNRAYTLKHANSKRYALLQAEAVKLDLL